MKLTKIAIKTVRASRKCINMLAYKLDMHAGSVDRLIKNNSEDAELTKAKAVDIIHQETGLAKNKIITK